jgi:hypothetical protein
MRSYPTVATHPNRKQRKTLRKSIFYENKYSAKAARSAARRAKKGSN